MKLKQFVRRNQRLLFTLGSLIFIIAGTSLAIMFAKGYRPTRSGIIEGTGLLAVISNPPGARVYIDGKLASKVTDDTLSLYPGEYQIEIKQDGFTSWQKLLTVEPELVTTADAHLFRTVPTLAPLTFSGARNLNPSPDGQKIAFSIASPSAQFKDGLYIIELSDRPALFSKGPKLIAETPLNANYADAQILWSPDSNQIVASFPNATYLLPINTLTRRTSLSDATVQLSLLLNSWEDEIVQREKQLLLQLPDELLPVATASAQNIYFSPNGEKMLYTATQEVTLPDNLIPPLPASNSQPQTRTLTPGNTYVYDLKEDKNFLLFENPADPEAFVKPQLITDLTETSIFSPEATASARPRLQDPVSLAQTITNFKTQYSSFPFLPYQWYPTGQHLLYTQNGSINLIEYDDTNPLTLFSGSFEEEFVYPWPNGSKLIILTNLTQNPILPPNLYTINLK